jgi:copper chaperone
MITRAEVRGMSCQHCVRAVFTALGALEGVSRADVSLGLIELEHDGRIGFDAIRDAVAVAGYDVVGSQTNRRVLPQL